MEDILHLKPLPAANATIEELSISAFPPVEWTINRNVYTETRHRCIGRVKCSMRDELSNTLMPHFYSIVHIEQRSNIGLYSSYRSRILIGDPVDTNNELDLFFREAQTPNHLWCSNCWKDDFYGNGTGGVEIPHYFFASYLSRLESLAPCEGCGATFKVFHACVPLEEGEAHVFRVFQSKEVRTAVEAFFLQRGGPAECIYVRAEHDALTPDEAGQLITEAMSPERVGKLITEHGISVVRKTFELGDTET